VNLDIARFEVTGVYSHPDAKVDIVLVHGLNGDPKRSWTDTKSNVFWPTDLLPDSLKDQHANVHVYGYNADVYSRSHDRSSSDNFLFQHAQTLITHLTTYRKSEGTTRRPIIWVAHSLGGLLLKRALLYSNDVRATHHEEYRSIYVSTYAIIFLGTPHMGSGSAAWGHVLQAMSDAVIPKKLFESESVLLKTLKRDNERLQEVNNHFMDIYQRFKIHMAHENHKTDLRGTK
jgi:alpha-beta hydrolase superfamily lysophospholipase